MMRRPSTAALAAALLLAATARAGVHVGIGIAVPPPPVVALPGPPPLAVVPPVPAVQYAPGLGFNLFVYGGQYFTFANGAWFWARQYGEPWVYLPAARVPRPLFAVPARYYRVPPGHRRHGRGRPHWHGHR
ncbi:MAG TPA: hypothetical protein VKW76_04095 [Candidatus Binatia bacterium]|nr:hypothetical protein [Candidatus Binatia bacterium]